MSMDIEILRKASLISVLSEKKRDEEFGDKNKTAPKDTYYLCYIFFFMSGFMTLMPMVFIGTAANYWMYKFRDATAVDDKANRTSLQSLYQSTSMVASALPSVVFTTLGIMYGKNFDARKWNIGSLIVIMVIFAVFSAFTKIDTDSWQTGFFVMSMIMQGINNAAVALYQLFTIVIASKFPGNFMKMYLLGQGGGILTDVLQVISISVTDSDADGALIYFITGTILVAVCICVSFGIQYTKIYTHYMENVSIDKEPKKEQLAWSEIKDVAKLIWPVLTTLLVMIFTFTCVHPSVTSLVVSQYKNDGGAWANKYFTPVIAFLLGDISSTMGRIASKGKITKSNALFWLVGIVLRTIVSVGFIMLCNAQPRSNLPVVFDEDWEYILYIIIYNFSGGLIMNICFLSLHGLPEGRSETALKLLTLAFAYGGAVFSANGVLLVKIL